jgi:hypothetical protein
MKNRTKMERTRQTRAGCLNSVLTWVGPGHRRGRVARTGVGGRVLVETLALSWLAQEPSSSSLTRRRRVGKDVSSSHSRPAWTSSWKVRRENL